MKRLFVGIPASDEIKVKLKPVLEALMEAGVKVALLENLHFTLKFLGDVSEDKILEIVSKLENLAKFPPFRVELKGIRTFGGKQVRMVWAGMECKEMAELMKKANELLNYIYREEHQKEIPHLTLARVNKVKDNEKLLNVIKKYQKVEFGEVLVDKFYLYESVLTPEGPAYTVVEEFELG